MNQPTEILFLGMPVHLCLKAPKDMPTIVHADFLKAGICPFCFEYLEKSKMEHEPYEVSKARLEATGSWEGLKKRHGSPTFYKLLEEMAEVHDRKSHDYASDTNPFGNYEFSGQVASMFAHSPKDAGFAGRLAEKLYRIANLERDGKIPKNESIEDTEKDLCVIVALWMAARRDRRNAKGGVQFTTGQPPKVEEIDRLIDYLIDLKNQVTLALSDETRNFQRNLDR